VKKNNLINGLFATLLIASPIVGADQKYPAADFEPQVVYQDSDYIAKNNQSSKMDEQAASSESKADPKYPAANFEPQVVYSDPNYKPNAAPSVSLSTTSNSDSTEISTNPTSENVAEVPAKTESQSKYLIGLIALGLVGAFLFKNQFKCGSKKTENKVSPVPVNKGGLTGVARYLNKASGTGVSRYLEKQVKSVSASTGVAKYIAKQVLVAKSTAAGAATGVEKYMRNRG